MNSLRFQVRKRVEAIQNPNTGQAQLLRVLRCLRSYLSGPFKVEEDDREGHHFSTNVSPAVDVVIACGGVERLVEILIDDSRSEEVQSECANCISWLCQGRLDQVQEMVELKAVPPLADKFRQLQETFEKNSITEPLMAAFGAMCSKSSHIRDVCLENDILTFVFKYLMQYKSHGDTETRSPPGLETALWAVVGIFAHGPFPGSEDAAKAVLPPLKLTFQGENGTDLAFVSCIVFHQVARAHCAVAVKSGLVEVMICHLREAESAEVSEILHSLRHCANECSREEAQALFGNPHFFPHLGTHVTSTSEAVRSDVLALALCIAQKSDSLAGEMVTQGFMAKVMKFAVIHDSTLAKLILHICDRLPYPVIQPLITIRNFWLCITLALEKTRRVQPSDNAYAARAIKVILDKVRSNSSNQDYANQIQEARSVGVAAKLLTVEQEAAPGSLLRETLEELLRDHFLWDYRKRHAYP